MSKKKQKDTNESVSVSVPQARTISFESVYKQIVKGVKQWKFWGKTKINFKHQIPADLNDILEEELRVLIDGFDDLKPGAQNVSKRHFINVLIATALQCDVNEDGDIIRPVQKNNMKKFIENNWEELEEEFYMRKSGNRKKK